MATLNRNLRVTILAFKKDEISEEEFHDHWSKVHAPIVAEFMAKAGVIRYTQYHTTSSVRKEVHEFYERLGAPHRPFPEYDGLVEIVVPNMETYMNLSKDPYYKRMVAPDEAKFFDWKKTFISFGWEETYVENGRPLVSKEGVARL